MQNACQKRYFITISVFGLLLFSCIEKPKGYYQGISEGEILYNITYPQEIESHDFSFIYPKEMTLYFKDNYQRLSFKGSMGMYYFDFIYGDKHDTVFTLMKIALMDKRLYATTYGENLLIFSEAPSNMELEITDETKEIAGTIAKKAVLKSPFSEISNIEAWYSDSISIKSPNQNTPFNQIQGVLLESEITYKDVKFIFKAHKITSKQMSDEIFKVPAEYKITSISEIAELLNTVF